MSETQPDPAAADPAAPAPDPTAAPAADAPAAELAPDPAADADVTDVTEDVTDAPAEGGHVVMPPASIPPTEEPSEC